MVMLRRLTIVLYIIELHLQLISAVPLDHILAIRDAPSHVPLQSVRVRSSVLLEHMRNIRPDLKPVAVSRKGKFDFRRYTFNYSDWNAGLADYLSHPTVKHTINLEDIKNIPKPEPPMFDEQTESSKSRRSVKSLNRRKDKVVKEPGLPPLFNQIIHNVDSPPRPPIQMDSSVDGWGSYKLEQRFDCFDKGIWADLRLLQEAAERFCLLFDQHMYVFITSGQIRDLREFSLGSIWEAVDYEFEEKNPLHITRVNFQFTYAPYSHQGTAYWYPMSVFSGIQGFCHKFLINFLHPEITPCKGKNPDSKGGWIGFNAGGEPRDQWFARWSIDPYPPRDRKKEKDPYFYPDWEDANGLASTRPWEIWGDD